MVLKRFYDIFVVNAQNSNGMLTTTLLQPAASENVCVSDVSTFHPRTTEVTSHLSCI